MSVCNEERIDVKVTIDSETYVMVRAILFKKGVSFQDFVNHVAVLLSEGDEQITKALEEAMEKRASQTVISPHSKNPNELFNILEHASALKSG